MFSAYSRVSTVFRLSPVWLVLLGAFALPAVAQAPFPPADNVGTFRGRLFDTDTGQPITEDITVVIQQAPDASRRVVDVAGEFVVSDLPVGRYALLFR
jgi:hypothetical protein